LLTRDFTLISKLARRDVQLTGFKATLGCFVDALCLPLAPTHNAVSKLNLNYFVLIMQNNEDN
jgi:hypothetical protein